MAAWIGVLCSNGQSSSHHILHASLSTDTRSAGTVWLIVASALYAQSGSESAGIAAVVAVYDDSLFRPPRRWP